MRPVFLAATAALSFFATPPELHAQSGEDFSIPAEFPPSSFTGRQYVDSRGCIYIRAGIDGVTTWVPRVTRNRETICGAEPSLVSATSASEPVSAAPSSAVSGSTSAAAGSSGGSSQPLVATRKSVAPMSSTSSQRASAPANPPVVRDDRRLQRATPETVGPNVRIAPRHVYEEQLAAQDGVFVPRGYEPVWDDGRLSLTRAHQTYSGQAQMAQFWDNRTPRRLVEREEAPAVTVSSRGTATAAPVVSSRSVAAAEAERPASHRFVEAGLFETEDKARVAAQYIAEAGLPAALSTRRHKGRSYATALAGPFATQAELDTALEQLRQAYPGATLRR